MTTKQIKRLLALLKSEVELNRNHNLKLPQGFKESFENQKHFRGWINYKVTWFIEEKSDPWKVIPLSRPLIDDWHDHLRAVLPVITETGEVVSVEQWEQKSHSTK